MKLIATKPRPSRTKKNGRRPTVRDLRIAGLTCIALNLKRTARVVSAIYDDAVRSAGLRSTQFAILATIGHNPEVSITQLSEWIDADRTTAQRSLEILGKRGWIVAKKAHTGNLRQLALTPSGEKKLAEAYELWEETQNRMTEAIGHRAARTLLHDLSQVRKIAR